MSDSIEEIYSSNKKLKAIIVRRSRQVIAVQLFLLNEGVIQGYGQVHEPAWESITGTIFTDTLERARELVNNEFQRLSAL